MQEQVAYTKQKFEKIVPWFEAINNDLLKAPISIVLLVTDDCPCHCHMCTHWEMEKKYSLDYETFRSIMLACQKNGTQSVFLSGGDCFSWEYWERFLRDTEIVLDVQITTPLIIPENFDIQLLKRLRWLRVSYDAIKPETFRQIRGVYGLGKIKRDLKFVVENKLVHDVGVTTVLQKANHEEIEEMGEFLVELGIKRWIIQPVNHYPEMRIPESAVIEMAHKLLEKFGEAIPINNWDVLIENFETFNKTESLPCMIPRMEAFIDAQLRVWPCCNISQDSFGDEERATELLMGALESGPNAGEEFLKLWLARKNYLDKFPDFKKIHRLCGYTCQFKYFYYNLGFKNCLENRKRIYI